MDLLNFSLYTDTPCSTLISDGQPEAEGRGTFTSQFTPKKTKTSSLEL